MAEAAYERLISLPMFHSMSDGTLTMWFWRCTKL